MGASRDLCVSEWIREHLFLGSVFRIGKLHTTVGWHLKRIFCESCDEIVRNGLLSRGRSESTAIESKKSDTLTYRMSEHRNVPPTFEKPQDPK